MEDSVPNSVCIVRMAGYALQALQWSCSISTIYEQHLCRYARCLCRCYLDDILIYSDNMNIHKPHVREVLKRLRENGLYASTNKCEFHSESIEYLGFRLSPEVLSMDPAKIQTIQDWPEPQKVNDIQTFLSFANFYSRFIANYSDIVIPLTRLTRKSNKWNFNDKC